MICPCVIYFLYRNIIRCFTHYATADSRGIAFIYKKLYRAVWWRITTNVFGCITEKNGRSFCCIATYFRGCNGIGDLLTRQARNFIYSMLFNIKLMEMYDCNKSLSFLAHMDAHTYLGVHGCGLRLWWFYLTTILLLTYSVIRQ